MFKKILVPLDGSALAEQAVDPALRLVQWAAGSTGSRGAGELIFMRVPMYASSQTPVSPAHEYAWPQERHLPVKGESAEYLRDLREDIKSKAGPNVSIRTMVVNGDRAGAIVDTAQTEQADLIVMSTYGRTGLSRWVLGSVTSRVLRHAHCPVLVINASTSQSASQSAPMAHILITFDGSLLSEKALEVGLALAKANAAQVTLLRVLSNGDFSSDEHPLPENIAISNNKLQKEPLHHQAESYLQDLVAIHDTEGLEINIAVIAGPVASTILDFATNEKVDLIAMTTHGRTGIRRWIYGSVTENVLYGTSCAMLIIRPPEH